MELTKIMEEDKIAPVILLTSTWEQHFFEKAQNSWVFAFLVKPIQEGHLLATSSFVINAFQRMLALEHQVRELKDTLETRKLIDRAKGILMKKLGLSEDESYRKIQQESMDQCLPMKEIAEKVILTYDI
jgi:response regulator NasT